MPLSTSMKAFCAITTCLKMRARLTMMCSDSNGKILEKDGKIFVCFRVRHMCCVCVKCAQDVLRHRGYAVRDRVSSRLSIAGGWSCISSMGSDYPKKGDLLRECAKGSLIKLPAGDGKVCVNSRYYIGGKHRLWSQS